MRKRDAAGWRYDDRFAFSSPSARSIASTGAGPLTFVLSTIMLVLFVLGYIAYFFSYLAPTLMLILAFRMPFLMGLVLPALLIGALYLILSGSFFMGLGIVLAAFICIIAIASLISFASSTPQPETAITK